MLIEFQKSRMSFCQNYSVNRNMRVGLAIALGAPLGEFTMGGKFPGKLPNKMRVAALITLLFTLPKNIICLSITIFPLQN